MSSRFREKKQARVKNDPSIWAWWTQSGQMSSDCGQFISLIMNKNWCPFTGGIKAWALKTFFTNSTAEFSVILENSQSLHHLWGAIHGSFSGWIQTPVVQNRKSLVNMLWEGTMAYFCTYLLLSLNLCCCAVIQSSPIFSTLKLVELPCINSSCNIATKVTQAIHKNVAGRCQPFADGN